jgi:asparagine synthase (glutamine-hydrolysing)
MKALLVDPRVDRKLDPLAVEEYFALGYVPDPRTILRGVHKLPPAHTLTIVRGQPVPAPKEYWDVDLARPATIVNEREACDELTTRLRGAVDRRLLSEVPLGAFLSGGVDSSAIVAYMAESSATPVNTCSISFGEREFDESEYAAAVASRYQTNHRVDQADPHDFGLLDRLPAIYDEPFADSSAMPTFQVCKLARRHVTVALSGDGGDEVFAGYRRYRWHMLEERARSRLPRAVRRGVFGLLGQAYPKMDWAPRFLRAKATFQGIARDSVEAYFHSVSFINADMRQQLFSNTLKHDLNGYNAFEVFRRHAKRVEGADPLAQVQYLDIKTYLPGDILVKVDRASMANSLEVRAPLLDYTLIDWAAGLAQNLKLRDGEGKYVLKRSLESRLSADTLYRPKMGFGIPLAGWFRGPLRESTEKAMLSGALVRSGLLEPAALRRVFEAHQSGRADYGTALWTLRMFDGFLSNVLRV